MRDVGDGQWDRYCCENGLQNCCEMRDVGDDHDDEDDDRSL